MTNKEQSQYRERLEALRTEIVRTAAALEEQVRAPTGGQAAGSLSNAPFHLGDVGTEVYTQEMNTALYENEARVADEIAAALERIDQGTFGVCENCGTAIPPGRLEVLPYARHCTACAEKLQATPEVNFNDGRPEGGSERPRPPVPEPRVRGQRRKQGSEIPFTDLEAGKPAAETGDTHAAGTPGGGSAIGGLAGTNLGEGDAAYPDLEEAMGSGNFDAALAGGEEDEAYGGPCGGAVGGTPANKRAVGGHTGGGVAPRPEPGDSPTGQ